jgi:glutaredoxin-like protein
MIPLAEQQGIRDLFAEALKSRVKIDYFTQRRSSVLVPGREECRFCEDVQTLLEELSRLHNQITLTVHERGANRDLEQKLGVSRVPATVIRGVLNRPVIVFGFPMGTLFPALVESIVLMSQNRTELPPSVTKKLKRLREPVSVRVFVTPDSEFCPPMMLAAFAFAIESKLVKAEVIEIAEFERLAERYHVEQVPFTVIDDRVAFPGAVDLDTFADQLVKAKASPTLSAQLPRSGGATLLKGEASKENVRPSGLIIPGR